MSDLWVMCEHGEKTNHVDRLPPKEIAADWPPGATYSSSAITELHCPGGHKATVEEVVEWLREQPGFMEGMAAASAFIGPGDYPTRYPDPFGVAEDWNSSEDEEYDKS